MLTLRPVLVLAALMAPLVLLSPVSGQTPKSAPKAEPKGESKASPKGAPTATAAPKAAPKATPKSTPQAPAKPASNTAAAPKAESKPATQAAVPAVGGAQPTLLGQYGIWGAYTATPGGKKICFALAKPTSSKTNPPDRPRDPAYAFISTRPAEKVKNEVSIMMGYGVKQGSEATLQVGDARFAMYTQGDSVWIKNAAEEDRMVEMLRKGADVTIKAVSARGTETTDVFSLRGAAQALDRVAQDCR